MTDLQPSVATDEAPPGAPPPERGAARLEFSGEVACLHLTGRWTKADPLPTPEDIVSQIPAHGTVRRLEFEAVLTAWDSCLLTFLSRVLAWCAGQSIAVDLQGLPAGVRRLLELAAAVPAHPPEESGTRPPWLARVGSVVLGAAEGLRRTVAYVGEVVAALANAALGRVHFRGIDLALAVQACGAEAFPIVSLISFLSGIILAFVGAVQLRQFGAQIYVADLVAIAMAQEMGALMTGIIMAGRSGAAFAAQIGAMQANEEIDALVTLGVSPVEFLVLPRGLALVVMMPLLTLYADLLGMLGGGLIGILMLRLRSVQYWDETRHALLLSYFVMGLVKSVAYGIVIALAACYRGLRSGRSSMAVGAAVTAAVVTSIVLIVCADTLLTVIYHVLGY